ncbi:hypothetical protein P7L75_01385 (plasmid) [Tistrella mobilis]|uniref:hypothetical protein n=1 Tax=Tistrella mobilis TaxID=171437 RepID=UPI0035571EB8
MTMAGASQALRDIAELIGDDLAMRLAASRGGQTWYVPRPDRLRPDHWLIDLLGQEAALALCQRYGPGDMEIPSGYYVHAAARAREIGAAAGSTREIAARYGVTERWVRMCRAAVRSAADEDVRQPRFL